MPIEPNKFGTTNPLKIPPRLAALPTRSIFPVTIDKNQGQC